MNEVAALGI